MLAAAAGYRSPYPAAGLIGHYDTKFGRPASVVEAGGAVTAWRNHARGPGALPDLAGSAEWVPSGSADFIGFRNGTNMLAASGFSLPVGYTLVMVVQARVGDLTGSSFQGSGVGVFLAGYADGHTVQDMLLYTGGGGENNVLKFFAGANYREGAALAPGRNVLAASVDDTGVGYNRANANQQPLSTVGTTTINRLVLGGFGAGSAQLLTGLLLVYNRSLLPSEVSDIYLLAAQQFSIPA